MAEAVIPATSDAPALESPAPAQVDAPIAASPAPVESAIEAAPEPVVEAEVKAEPVAEPVVEAAPVEPAPVEGEKVAEGTVETPAVEAPAPTYETFKMPEGVQAAPEQIETFTGILGKYGLTQEAGQELMDLYGNAAKEAADAMVQRQQDVFAETQAQWVKDFDKSAGNKRDTILNDAKWAITNLVPDGNARKEVWQVLAYTGAGNNKHVINLLASAAKKMRERAAPPSPTPTNPGKATNPADRRYGAAKS